MAGISLPSFVIGSALLMLFAVKLGLFPVGGWGGLRSVALPAFTLSLPFAAYISRLVRFGGHGYGHIFRNVVPMMGRRGFSQAEIDAILVGNPRRLLTFA